MKKADSLDPWTLVWGQPHIVAEHPQGPAGRAGRVKQNRKRTTPGPSRPKPSARKRRAQD
jgi:hypothetical protein